MRAFAVICATACLLCTAWAGATTVTTGDASLAGYRDIYKVAAFTPGSAPVTVTGTVNMTAMAHNSAAMIGLVDKAAADASTYGAWQQGAYAYFGYRSDKGYRIGASDGNVGGELISGGAWVAPDGSGQMLVPFQMVIGAGQISFTSGSFSEAISYSATDFASGSAYLTIDFWPNSGGPIAYNVTATDGLGEPPVPEPLTMASVALGLAGLGRYVRRRVKA